MPYSTHLAAHDIHPKQPDYSDPETENEYYARSELEFRHIRTFWNWLVLVCTTVATFRTDFTAQKPAHSI